MFKQVGHVEPYSKRFGVDSILNQRYTEGQLSTIELCVLIPGQWRATCYSGCVVPTSKIEISSRISTTSRAFSRFDSFAGMAPTLVACA